MVQMHALGLRWGGKVLQQCVRMLPFWQAWFTDHPNQSEPFSKVCTAATTFYATRCLMPAC